MNASKTLDIRGVSHADWARQVFNLMSILLPGDRFFLVSDQDPKLLLEREASRSSARILLHWLQQGPCLWRVEIQKDLKD